MKYIYLILWFFWVFFGQSLTATDAYTNHENLSEVSQGDDEPPVKRGKRKRNSPPVLKACDNCRIKHLKCSDKKPCETCTSKGIECKGYEYAYKFYIFDADSEQFTEVQDTSKNKKKPKKEVCNASNEAKSQQIDFGSLPAVVVCPACQYQFSPENPYFINQPAPATYPVPTQYFMNPNLAAHDPFQAQLNQFQPNQSIAVQQTTSVEVSTATYHYYNPYMNTDNSGLGPGQQANNTYPSCQGSYSFFQ